MTRRDPIAVVVCFGVWTSLALPVAAGAQTVTFTNASAMTIPAQRHRRPDGRSGGPASVVGLRHRSHRSDRARVGDVERGPGYVPVQADQDGDGITDFAVYQTSSGIWTILEVDERNAFGFTVAYGGPAYTPVAGDWDGDGRADVGVYDTAGNWSILLTGGNYTTSFGKSWGGAGFAPLPVFQ